MKKLLLVAVFIFSGKNLFPQNFINYSGYVIFKNNDTLFTRLRIENRVKNIEFSNLFVSVLYYNKMNRVDTAFANDSSIIGYGFKKDSSQYYFHRLTLNSFKNKSGDVYPIYAWRISNGPLQLFAYGYDIRIDRFAWSKTLYQNVNPNSIMHEYTKNRRIKYYFKKNNNELIQIAQDSDGSPQVKWLKAYFKDYSSLSKKIGKDINAFDLETMVNEYNQWYQTNSQQNTGN